MDIEIIKDRKEDRKQVPLMSIRYGALFQRLNGTDVYMKVINLHETSSLDTLAFSGVYLIAHMDSGVLFSVSEDIEVIALIQINELTVRRA